MEIYTKWFGAVWHFLFGPLCPGSITIAMATIKHLTQAVVCVFGPAGATASVGLHAVVNSLSGYGLSGAGARYMAAMLLAGAAVSASYAMHNRAISHRGVCAMLLPQQILLFISWAGAATAVATGAYADGYVPEGGGWMIMGDQIIRLLLFPCYTVAILARANARLFGDDAWMPGFQSARS